VSPEGSGFGGLVLTYVVRSEERVDEIMAEAEKAGGATILKPAAALEWGGSGGSFATPMATSGVSAIAPKVRISPTRSSVRHGTACTGADDER
jgi:hypothetical protein